MIHRVIFSDTLPRATLRQWLNPIWWLSDTERNPAWSWWAWYWRNPDANFKSRIIGISSHAPRRWYSAVPGGELWPARGWCFAITMTPWCLPRYWIGHRGARFEKGHGWKTSGGFTTLTWRNSHATNAGPTS